MPSKTDLAWGAGIIDGEGCIYIQCQRRKDAGCWNLVIGVDNTDERMILKLYRVFGGTIGQVKRKLQIGWRPTFYWRVFGNRAAATLWGILPFAVAKREQVELGLEYLATRVGYGHRVSPAALSQRQILRAALKTAKRRTPTEIEVNAFLATPDED